MQVQLDGKTKLKALKISAVAIFSVVIVEVTVGSLVNSLAIISDGLHALLDALACVMLFFAVRAAMKPADEEHTYGHEKFETIGGLIGGIILIAVACIIFYEAASRLIFPPEFVGRYRICRLRSNCIRPLRSFIKSYSIQEKPACQRANQ